MKKILALSYHDFKNILREPMLLLLMAGPLAMILAVRWVVPMLGRSLTEYIDLTLYYPLIAGFIVLFTPMLFGMLIGFLLLDERDENVLMTLVTTPLGKEGYLIYRILLPLLVSFAYGLLTIPFINIVKLDWLSIIPIAFLSAWNAPICALFLATVAGNKVEGLTLSKGLGIFMLAPIIEFFVDSPWTLIAGIVPFYWPVNAVLIGDYRDPSFWGMIIGGLIVHSIVLVLFFNRFKKRFN